MERPNNTATEISPAEALKESSDISANRGNIQGVVGAVGTYIAARNLNVPTGWGKAVNGVRDAVEHGWNTIGETAVQHQGRLGMAAGLLALSGAVELVQRNTSKTTKFGKAVRSRWADRAQGAAILGAGIETAFSGASIPFLDIVKAGKDVIGSGLRGVGSVIESAVEHPVGLVAGSTLVVAGIYDRMRLNRENRNAANALGSKASDREVADAVRASEQKPVEPVSLPSPSQSPVSPDSDLDRLDIFSD